MICYVLAMEKQHLGPHVVVGYGIKIFWPGLFITSPDHLAELFFSSGSLKAFSICFRSESVISKRIYFTTLKS